MLHIEIVPIWLMLAIPAGMILAVALRVKTVLRERRKGEQRRERRRKTLAHQRAWEWLMGRRLPRLTDERSSRD
jgi:predicted signal transduction protein with EAL and GGDEF domain